MSNMITLFGLLSIPVSLSVLSLTGKWRKPLTKGFLGLVLMSSLVVLSGCGGPNLTLDDDSIETNEVGLAVIKGTANEQAKITVDGQSVPTDNGAFSYDFTLIDDSPQKVTVTSQYKEETIKQTITVKASESFIKHLAKEEARLATEAKEKAEKEKLAKEIKQAETAIVLAETQPNQKNYDSAFTLVKNLTNKNKEFSTRLETVKQEIQLAAETAAKIDAAETALATAEEQPTKDHYDTAKLAIAAVPSGADQLTKRLDAVNTTIVAAEQEAARQKEIAAQAAAAETTQLAETGGDQASPTTTQMVLVTPTGKKYHTYKCGNGTYTEASMETALSRGLEPCSKCF